MKSKINASAAKRILGLPQSRRVTFSHVADRVLVADEKTGEAYVLSEDQFSAHHEQHRRDGARECVARLHRTTGYNVVYGVVGAKGDIYYVEIASGLMQCSCEDWLSFEEDCKHCYAVLNLLGADTLTDYLNRERSRFMAEHYGKPRLQVRGVSIE